MITEEKLRELEKKLDEALSQETPESLKKYIKDYDPLPTQVYNLSIQRDGGTININTDAGVYCVDHRYDTDKIGSVYRIEDRSYKYPRNHIVYVKLLTLLDEVQSRGGVGALEYRDVCFASDAYSYITKYLTEDNDCNLVSLWSFLMELLEDINRDSIKYLKEDQLDSIRGWIDTINNLPESVFRSKENTKIHNDFVNRLMDLDKYKVSAQNVGSLAELNIEPDSFGSFILVKDVQNVINNLIEENER